MPRYHPAPSRNDVAVVQPVLVIPLAAMLTDPADGMQVKHIGSDMLTDITFMSRGILTASRLGHIKLWIRPLVVKPRHLRNQSYRRDSWVDSTA